MKPDRRGVLPTVVTVKKVSRTIYVFTIGFSFCEIDIVKYFYTGQGSWATVLYTYSASSLPRYALVLMATDNSLDGSAPTPYMYIYIHIRILYYLYSILVLCTRTYIHIYVYARIHTIYFYI